MRTCLLYGALGMGLLGLVPSAGVAGQAGDDLPGPIDSIQDLQQTAKMLFKMADTNNDGQISQKEAIDVGNLLVGGFFFRADANGDGILTPEEARQARESLFQQQPLLRYALERARPTNAAVQPVNPPGALATTGRVNDPARTAENVARDPIRTIGNLLDADQDRRIQATELRQAVQNAVQRFFAVADINRDGLVSPAELNAAAGALARRAVLVAFQAADADRNGALSQAEFDRALTGPAHAAFRILDGNSDGQLSLDELQRARQVLVDQIRRLRVPEPGNSPLHRARPATSQPLPVTPTPSAAPAPAPAAAPQP